MASKDLNIILPVNFNQIFDLARQLPKNERRRLADKLMQEDYEEIIPEEHKELVRARIKKYNENPGLLIDEDQAFEMINSI
jgi:hypothetical protein